MKKELKPKDKAKIKDICRSLRKTLTIFSKSDIFPQQPRIFSLYGEIIVINKLLKKRHNISRKGNQKVDFTLSNIHKTVEVKTSS